MSGILAMMIGGAAGRSQISYVFASNTPNASLNLSGLSGYAAGSSDITITINAGVYLYATSTANYGLNITDGTTGDTLKIINKGYIIGMGGNGGSDPTGSYYNPASAGGGALNISINANIDNSTYGGWIAGGGGGGANIGGGGGAGGGVGGAVSYWDVFSNLYLALGGAGGGIGAVGGVGEYISGTYSDPESGGTYGFTGYGGVGGGRVLPSTLVSAGNSGGGNAGGHAGGGGGYVYYLDPYNSVGSTGTAGGTYGAAANTTTGIGGGGGWGSAGGDLTGYVNGGAGGKSINLNGKSVSWTGTAAYQTYGAIA